MVTQEELLQSRVKRQLRQERLLARVNGCLITMTMNIPGFKKNSNLIKKGHLLCFMAVEEVLKQKGYRVLDKEIYSFTTGPEGYLVVEADGLKVKELVIEFEELHKIGRLLDIDVIDSFQGLISRKRFGLEARTCFICNENANVCRRLETHSAEELVDYVEETLEHFCMH